MSERDVAIAFLRSTPIRSEEDLKKCATYDRSDTGNALRLVTYFGSDIRFVPELGWIAWNGRFWDRSSGEAQARLCAHQVVELIKAEAKFLAGQNDLAAKGHFKFAAITGQSARIRGMLREAEVYCEVGVSELDASPLLLTCRNGSLRLRSLHDAGPDDVVFFSGHSRSDLATLEMPVCFDAAASCPKWEQFLRQIMPDEEIRAYLQRLLGYCLTGSTKEQVFFVFHGTGGNGKTTVLRVIGKLMGPLRATLPIEALLKGNRRNSGSASPEYVRLRNARLATTSEPPANSRLSEASLKDLTGGDPMFERPLFKDAFEFVPTFKIVMSMNDKPVIAERDQGIWRRIHVVPFDQTIPESDRVRDLHERFNDELPGVLNWLLDGLRCWNEIGLSPPEAVIHQIEDLRSELDWLSQYLSDEVEFIDGGMVSGSDLYGNYRQWAERNGRSPLSNSRFGRDVTNTGIRKEKLGGRKQYQGIKLRSAGVARG